jgi:hypothetical protein
MMSKLTELALSEAGLLLMLVECRAFVSFPAERILGCVVFLFEALVLFLFSVNFSALLEMNSPWYVVLPLICGLLLYMCFWMGWVPGRLYFTSRIGTPGAVRSTLWCEDILFGALFALIFHDCSYMVQHALALPAWATTVPTDLGYIYGVFLFWVKIGSCPWCGKEVSASLIEGEFRSCQHCGEPYFRSSGKLLRGKGVIA